MKVVLHTFNPSQGHRRGRSASFVMKALPAAMMLVFSQPGWSVDIAGAAGLPQNGSVISGSASEALSGDGNHLTVTAANRSVLDWASFSVLVGKTMEFVQPAGGAVLNRVGLGADASQIMGTLKANGTLMLMNPNGVMFGAGSSVNVGSLIATTGTIDKSAFENHGHAIITGATGSISNLGNISSTAGASGLVAIVAPSVINRGTITATGGSIALAGSTAATISLNGGLYEFAIPGGATGTAVTNAAGASLNAANLYLQVGDAANLLSGVINLEGVQQASSAIVANGNTVELKSALQATTVSGASNTVNVSGAARIEDGVNIVRSGGAVNVAAGTYVQAKTLKIDKSLTLSGAGEGATTIDARGVTGYGVQVTADNVTLKDFTVFGPTANVSSSYGIKVAPASAGSTTARLHDFSIRNVTIRGSGRAELDLNGVVGAVIDHVTADGAPVGNDAGTTAGAGIQITDSANVTVSNSVTRNNQWGGLALYQANIYHDQQVNNITVAASNSFTEINPVYLQDQSASKDFGALNIAGFDHAVRNSSSSNSNNQYTWLQATQQKAFDFAVNLGASASSYVQGWNGATTTQNFEVGTGNLLAGGTQAMSIGSAVGAASAGAAVDVYAGTYAEQLVLNKAGLTLTGHEGAKLLVPDATEVNGISIAANNVTVTGMEIAGPVTQPWLNYAWGNNISRGIAVGNGVTGFVISNNTIHDVRNGVLIHGNNTGSVTGNRIDNTKSAISVQYTDGNGITLTGNTQGTQGNEWGLNLHLNGHMAGSTIVSNSTPISADPTLAWQQALLDLSAANAGWSVQDQAYTASNRTHVNVAEVPYVATNQGSLLSPLNTIQAGVNAVVTGGKVNVGAGTFSENVSIGKALTLKGAGVDQSIVNPASGDAFALSGNIGAGSTMLIDGFTFRDAPGSGVSVAADTVLGQLTVQNSSFRNNGHYGFSVNGSATAGVPGLANVLLSDNTFEGNGNPAGGATALGLGDVHFNYFNGNATLKNLRITGSGEHTGIHFRGYHNASGGAVHDAGTLVFDNVTLEGSFRRPSSTIGTWNPGGPGYAIHLFEYGSVANVSFSDVAINATVGHGLAVEGLGSTLDIGNTRFGMADTSQTGTGTNPTASLNIITGSNAQNNVKTNVNATLAAFTGAGTGFDIEDRVGHALDTADAGLVTWSAGNVYVTQKSGSVQRGVDAASAGSTVNVAAGTFAENVSINKALTLDGAGSTQTIIKAPSSASGTAVTISNASDVTLSDLQIADSFYGLQMTGTSNNLKLQRLAFDNNRYGIRNGSTVRADNFQMLDSSITGGLIGFQTYNSYDAGSGLAKGSFKNALFENVTVSDTSFKGFYFETADKLTMKNVTITNAGNVGDPDTHKYGAAIDVNLKYDAFDSLTFENVVINNSGHSSGTDNHAAFVIKTRGIPGDTAYAAAPASLQSVSIIGGSIEGSLRAGSVGSTGLRLETLSNGSGGQPTVTVSGTRFKGNGTDIAVDNTNVDARGAVFVDAANGFAIEDRVTHALDATGRGLVTWEAGKVYVTQDSGSIQRGVDASGVGDTVNVASATFAENVAVNSRRDLAFNDTRLQSLTLGSGAAGSGIGGTVTAEGAGGFNFDKDASVRLLSDTTLATTGANITLNGDIQNAGDVARGLRLLAGTGAVRGNVHMNTGGTTSKFLGALDVSANDFKLDSTLWVSAYKIDALGKVALSNSTLRAQDTGGTNTLNAGGSVTGSTISQGKVEVTSAGDIQANIAGTDVTAQAQGAMNVVVTASQTATLTADTIVANIKAADVVAQSQGNMNVVVAASGSASLGGGTVVADVAAPVVAVQATNDAQVSGSAGQITLNAPKGSVSGSFGQVSNTGGGVVNVNGKPQTNQTVSSNAENNRVIPAGGAQDSGAEGGVVQVAQGGETARQGGTEISLATPEAAGETLDNGGAVELDMSPRKQNNKKDKEEKEQGE